MITKQVESTNQIDPLFEWAVFGHLDRETNLELILLKGHLLLSDQFRGDTKTEKLGLIT